MKSSEFRAILSSSGLARLLGLLLIWVPSAQLLAQDLSYDNRRDVEIPDHSTLRIGPFYSTVRLTESVGYRYTTSSGAGADLLIDNRRGEVRSDGSDFPIVSRLDFRNYLVISRHTDLDLSLRVTYRYFPLNTQEDDFNVSLPEEGVGANVSSQFRLTPHLIGSVFDRFLWTTDFVDDRGLSDRSGGRRYERIENTAGVDFDWLMAKDKNLGLLLSRRDVLAQEDEFKSQDRVTYTERITYEHQVVEGIVLGAGVNFQQTDYDDKARADTDQNDLFFFMRASGAKGARSHLPLSESTTLELSAGVSGGTEQRTGDSTSTTLPASTALDSATGTSSGRTARPNRTRSTMNAKAAINTDMTKYLSHNLGYERGLRGGFETSFEEYDRILYSISYNRVGVGVRVFTDYDTVERSDTSQGYDTWQAGVEVNYPIYEFVSLDGTYRRTLRTNRRESLNATGAVRNDETTTDITDNVLRLGTSVAVLKNVKWVTYVERRERTADLSEFDFVRNTFETKAVYTHDF